MIRTLLLLALVAMPLAVPAATLTSGDSESTVSDDGLITVWRVEPDGSDNIFLSGLYLRRDGETSESSLAAALGLIEEIQDTPDMLRRRYGGNGLDAVVDYRLTGGPEGSRSAILSRSVTLTNTADTPISLTLFDYTDLDIRFNPQDQLDQATLIAPGVIETVSANSPIVITTTVTPTPDAHQITDFLTLYFAFFLDQDGPTALTDTPALGEPFPVPAGDNAFAFEWGFDLAAGESVTVSQTSVLAPVPLPAAAALLLSGLGAFAALRGRGRRTMA
ncbi:MAG: calcium-binding protein [Pseudomonadota bacterium]